MSTERQQVAKKPMERKRHQPVTWWTAIAAFAAIAAAWAAWEVVWKPTISKREGFARITSQLDNLQVQFDQIADALPDSLGAGQSHASARHMGSSSIVQYEIDRSTAVMKDKLEVEWSKSNSVIGETLASMESDEDTLSPSGENERLYLRYSSLRTQKDSLLATIMRATKP